MALPLAQWPARLLAWAGLLRQQFGVAGTALAISGSAALATAFSFGGPPWLTIFLVIIWGAAVIPDSPQFSAIVADNAPPDLVGSLVTFQAALGFLLTVLTVHYAPLAAEAFSWPSVLAGLALGPLAGIVAIRAGLRP